MELEKNSKFKIYLVIAIFIMIILLSGYVVISKIVNHETIMDYDSINLEQKVSDFVLENSNGYIELSVKNDKIIKLYDLINDINIEKKLYLMKNLEFDWSKTSSVVLSSLSDNSLIYEDGKKYIDANIFNLKYNTLFGEFKIGIEKDSVECDSVSFDITTNRYLLNEDCTSDDVKMKTFFKNITYNENEKEISINKYYAFAKVTTRINIYTEYEGIDLFYDNDLNQIIVQDIKEEDINNYIYNMNVISYVFKKGTNGNYYLSSVK